MAQASVEAEGAHADRVLHSLRRVCPSRWAAAAVGAWVLAAPGAAPAEERLGLRVGAEGLFAFESLVTKPGEPSASAGSVGPGVFLDFALLRYLRLGADIAVRFHDGALDDAVLIDAAVVLIPTIPIDGDRGAAYFEIPVGVTVGVNPTEHAGIGWLTGVTFGLAHDLVAGFGVHLEFGWVCRGYEAESRSIGDVLSQFGIEAGLYYAF